MDDKPYTSPDEDPFHVDTVRTITHRRSSMLDKWIQEQQTPYFAAARSVSNPYLAYPDLPRASSLERTDDRASIISYDFVEDDDIPSNHDDTVRMKNPEQRTPKSSRHSITPSFKNLTLSFRSSPTRPSPSPSPRAFSKIFPRIPPLDSTTPQGHNRASSLSTLNLSPSRSTKRLSSSTTSRWRPSVLGHFYQPAVSIQESDTPSRPSISSADTNVTSPTTSTHTATASVDSHVNSLTSPSKLSLFDSIRIRGNRASLSFSSLPGVSASSLRLSRHSRGASLQEPNPSSSSSSDCLHESLPARVPFAPKCGSILDNIDDEDDLDDHHVLPTFRPAIVNKPPPSGTLPRVKFSSLKSRSQRKKKKLVISGIGAAETRKLDGIKRWCESFGDVRSMSRVPNGDLHIDFRDPDVADTVCRVRAKVYIAGVGSVQLSWIFANKR